MTELESTTQTAEQNEWLSKVCPECGRANDIETRICTCGFWFDKQEVLRHASDLPNLKRERLKKGASKLLIVASFIIVVLSTAAVWTGIIEFSKASSVEKTLSEETVGLTSQDQAEQPLKSSPKNILDGKVASVTDGNTIIVVDSSGGEHKVVRLSGIDVPDASQQSVDYLSNNLLGKNVQVVMQKIGDSEVLGKVLSDGKSINLEMVKAGLARHNKFSVLQTDEDRRLYEEAEAEARNSRAGIWSNPNAVPLVDNPVAGERNLVSKAGKPVAGQTVSAAETNSSNPEAAASNTQTNPAPNQNVSSVREIATQPAPVTNSEPAAAKSPTATARCNDGTLSYRTIRSGSCTGHSGVAEWLTSEKPQPTVREVNGQKYTLGPRGGCFYINSSGSKIYVDKSLCGQ